METIIVIAVASIVALFVLYFVIKAAVKDAMFDRMEHYQRVQTACLKQLARQAGMSEEDIEKAWLGGKFWKIKQKLEKKK